jgi:pimeloyl-ACP methyl ester carboxylesterase
VFALIPGAGGAAWYWHRVVPELQARDVDAVAVDLPGADPSAGLPEYTDAVVAAIGDRTSVLLAAQSLGGSPHQWSVLALRWRRWYWSMR